MKVLVTGGLGFIGSHISVDLLNKGYDVVIIDNLSNPKVQVLDRIEDISSRRPVFYEQDICNLDDLEVVFRDHRIDGIIHLAGFKAVGESVGDPLKYYYNNILGTLQLLKCCDGFKVSKLIYSSSATVYGDQQSPLREDMELKRPTNPYGETKVMIERILSDYACANPEFCLSVLRYFNPIGAHESGLIGEDPKGIPNNLMPYITKVAKGELPFLGVYGNDYETPDGTCIRDYIHVSDLSMGHISAFENISRGHQVYNLGTGRGRSVLEIINTFIEVNKVDIPYRIVDRRPGDIGTAYADVSKAKRVLKWVAKKSLEDMVRDSWNFAEKQSI